MLYDPATAGDVAGSKTPRSRPSKQVPFAKFTDEVGALARAVDVLNDGAAKMEEER